jgi:hypothetical protein
VIYARYNGKGPLTSRILAEHLAGLSEAEFLHELAAIFRDGGPAGYVISARLHELAATCEANEEASE